MPTDHLRRRAAFPTIMAIAAISGTLLLLLGPLLLQPDRFPSSPLDARRAPVDGTAAGDAHRSHVELIEQSRVRDASGKISYLDRDGAGRNRLAGPPALFTHPLHFSLGLLLPSGFSTTLLLLIHVLVGAASMFFLSRRLGASAVASLLAAFVFVLAGRLLDSATTPAQIALGEVAALFPALVLVVLQILERPSLWRGMFLGGVVAGMACSADIAAVLLATLLVVATVPALSIHVSGQRACSGAVAGMLLLGVIWGVALAGYRWLPVLAGHSAPGPITAGLTTPWWQGDSSIRLPFHLGAVTLVTTLLGFQAIFRSGRRGAGLLWVAGVGGILVVLGPLQGLPFLGFYLGLVSAAAVPARSRQTRPRVCMAATTVAIGLLLLEALAAQRPILQGQSLDDIAAGPRWVEFLGQHETAGRVAILDGGGDRVAHALAARRVTRAAGLSSTTIDDLDVPELVHHDVRTIISDLPDTRRRFRLIQYFRDERKYLYRNLHWRGPLLLTAPRTTRGGRPRTFRDRAVSRFKRDADRLTCSIELDSPAVLAIADPLVPGTFARVNGEPATLTARGVGRMELSLPAGTLDVEILFAPPGLEAGATLSAIAMLLAPILLVLPLFRHHRRHLEYRRLPTPRRRVHAHHADFPTPERLARHRHAVAERSGKSRGFPPTAPVGSD